MPSKLHGIWQILNDHIDSNPLTINVMDWLTKYIDRKQNRESTVDLTTQPATLSTGKTIPMSTYY